MKTTQSNLVKSLLILFVIVSCQAPKETSEMEKPPRKIPLEDFFRNPQTSQYRISPDGKYYSFMKPYKNRRNIYIRAIGSDEELRLTADTLRDIPVHFWANNSQILYLQDKAGDENHHLFIANIDGSGAKDLTDFDGVKVWVIDDLPDQENFVIIAMNKNNPALFEPYRLNLKTRKLTQLAENPGYITGWLTDHDGKLRVATTSEGTDTRVLYRDTETEAFREIMKTSFRDSFYPLMFTFDNKNLYVVSNLGRDKEAIVEFNVADRKETAVLFEHNKYDAGGLHYSRKRKALTHIDFNSWKNEFHYLDDEFKAMATSLVDQLNAEEIHFVGHTKAEDKFIFVTASDRSGTNYFIYDVDEKKYDTLATTRPWLQESELAEMKPISYTTRDSLTVEGYLTLPKGREAKNLPVVVNPHGGPWARDNWGFNPEVQFLANRGYAVLQMNFRGSTGYGKKFWKASFKQWGKKMQDDVTDGVKWLVEEGIADPERIAIYGGSYGGYATLAGLAFTPEVYAAGVDYVGVANLFTFMNTIPPYWEPFRKMMYEMVGNPEDPKDSLLLASATPVFHADKIVAPLFIAQGANDPRVNKAESDQMVAALKERGVDVEYMVKDNEGHGFRNEENRFDFYRVMEMFLAKHIGEEKQEMNLELPAGVQK